jgi:hypothetical protein
MLLFTHQLQECHARRQCVWAHARHAPPRNIVVLSYIRADRIALQLFPFLSELSQVSRSEGGRVTPSTRAYFLSPLKINPETGGHRLVLPSCLVVIYVKKNIVNESAACCAIGHFGQEVRKIEPSPDVSDKRFAHGNRFTDAC